VIDFRYHIVSLVAVFLALGLGILLGVTVFSNALPERIEADLRRARAARDDAQQRADQLTAELNSNERILRDEVAPWVVDRRLEGRTVLFLSDGGEADPWRTDVRSWVLSAGARPAGNLVLTEKWRLDREGSAQELVESVVRPIVPAFDPGQDPAQAALALLGQRLTEPTGQALVAALTQAGFVVVEGREGDQPWPPRESTVVVLSGAHPRNAPHPRWLAAFARGSSQVTGTLVVAGEPDAMSAVQLLRQDPGEAPRRLSTFDTAADDVGGIGVVSALQVAIAERGGHFGRGPDRRYLPQPA